MIRIIALLAIPALAFLTASCGCPRPVKPPSLPSMPNFKELPSADEIEGAGASEEVPVVPTK